jgi:glycosyltransferase involved in cell wall biosynthesis
MISTDRNIFDPKSAVARRMVEYGSLFDELHIVVFSTKKHGVTDFELSPNCFVYTVNSDSKFGYIFGAYKIGRQILYKVFFGQTIITTQDPFETGKVGWLLKRAFKVPLQMQIHTDLFSPYFFQSSPLNAIRVFMARFLLKRTDGIRVVRKKIADDIIAKLKIPRSKIQVLPILWKKFPTLATPILSRGVDGKKNILIVSRLESEKKVDLGLKIFAKVAKGREDLRLVIVGDGSLMNRLQNMAKKLGILDKVSFEGWREDVADFYKNAYIFLNTSEYEGFGMSLFESAHSGCAIVTTNVGIAQDVLGNGRSALVCPVGDEKCLSTKILNVLENPLFAQGLSQKAQEDIKKITLSKEEYLKQYKDGLEILLNNPK